MTTMMLASMMTGVKIGDEPSSPDSVAASKDCCAASDDLACPALPCPGSSFLPKTMSDGDLSAISIENDNGGRGAPYDRDNSSSTLGDVDEPLGTEQLVAVNFDKADLEADNDNSGGIRKSTSMVSFHSSCLKKSASRSSLAGSSKGGMRRVNSNVSFGSVSVREHERVVDDRPALPGPALALGWAYNQKDDVHLDEYMDERKKATADGTSKGGDEAPTNDGDVEGQTTAPAPTKEKKYVEQHLSSFARSVKLRSYGFEHSELKTEAQKAREALAEGKRMAELAKRRKEQKKLSYKVKKALRYFVTSES